MGKAIGQNAIANCPIFYSLCTVHVPFATFQMVSPVSLLMIFDSTIRGKLHFTYLIRSNVRLWLVNLIYGRVLATIGIDKIEIIHSNTRDWFGFVYFLLSNDLQTLFYKTFVTDRNQYGGFRLIDR